MQRMPFDPTRCELVPAMAGHRVGITADRRAEEQGELLRRMGAEAVFGPVMRTLPLGDDSPMRAATEALLAEPPSIVLLTTAIGLRSWIGAAETWGLADELLDLLGGTPLYTRGPKAYAAAIQLDLPVWRREPSERLDAMVAHLTRERLDGQHVGLQLYGNEVPWAVKGLEEAGARVTAVPVYRWVAPDDQGPARRLVRGVLDGQITAVTFTCPSAVVSACRIAEAERSLDALLAAFETRVVVACVGPTTAATARERGVAVACAPQVGRLGLLVRSLAATLRARHLHLQSPAGPVLVQGNLVVTDRGEVVLADRERQVLDVLARRPGRVISRAIVEREVWGSAGEDRALDAVLSRMRKRLAPTGLEVTTRVRRGYQLLADAVPCPVASDRAEPAAS